MNEEEKTWCVITVPKNDELSTVVSFHHEIKEAHMQARRMLLNASDLVAVFVMRCMRTGSN